MKLLLLASAVAAAIVTDRVGVQQNLRLRANAFRTFPEDGSEDVKKPMRRKGGSISSGIGGSRSRSAVEQKQLAYREEKYRVIY